MKALEIINEKLKLCHDNKTSTIYTTLDELEAIKADLEKSNSKNVVIKATDVRSAWDEDNDYLIGTCPICKNVDRVESVWHSDTKRRCSSCGQKLLFSLEKKKLNKKI